MMATAQYNRCLQSMCSNRQMLQCLVTNQFHRHSSSASNWPIAAAKNNRLCSISFSSCPSNSSIGGKVDIRLVSATLCSKLHTSAPVAAIGDKIKIKVKTDEETVELEGKVDDSILDIITDNNYEIPGYGACEGTIACSTCHVVLNKDDFAILSKVVTEEEKDLLDMVTNVTDTSRLGCQVYLTKEVDGITVYVPNPVDLRET